MLKINIVYLYNNIQFIIVEKYPPLARWIFYKIKFGDLYSNRVRYLPRRLQASAQQD